MNNCIINDGQNDSPLLEELVALMEEMYDRVIPRSKEIL